MTIDNLTAELLTDGWTVVDAAGGRWWPGDEAREAIARAEEEGQDPAEVVVSICRTTPMSGRWVA